MSLFTFPPSAWSLSWCMGVVVCFEVLSGEVMAEKVRTVSPETESGKPLEVEECPMQGKIAEGRPGQGPGSDQRHRGARLGGGPGGRPGVGPGGRPGGPRMHGAGSEMKQQWKKLDTNKNGYLSFEEFSKSPRLVRLNESKRRKLFDYLDRNKDGKLSMQELRPSAPGWMMALRKEFKRLDTDQTHGLSYEQFSKSSKLAKMPESERARIFKHLDRNQDGEIQLAELSRGIHRGGPEIELKKYDLDQSGGLSFEEFSQIPWVARIPENRRKSLLKKMDLKNDGEISPREIRRAWVERRKCVHPRSCGSDRKAQQKSSRHPPRQKHRDGEASRPFSIEKM